MAMAEQGDASLQGQNVELTANQRGMLSGKSVHVDGGTGMVVEGDIVQVKGGLTEITGTPVKLG